MYYTLLDSYTVTFSTKLFIITNLIIVFCEKYNLIILLKITFGHFISFSLFELRICEIYLSIAYKFSSFCYFWNIVQGYTTCHYYLFMEPDHNHIVVTKSIFFLSIFYRQMRRFRKNALNEKMPNRSEIFTKEK